MRMLEHSNPLEVVKEAFWLAWKACGGLLEAGILQDRPNANKDQVWEAVYNKTDYPGGNVSGGNKLGDVYADYVFGRMMKVGFKWDDKSVSCRDTTPRVDYQAWCHKYPTYQKLLEAAVESLAKT